MATSKNIQFCPSLISEQTFLLSEGKKVVGQTYNQLYDAIFNGRKIEIEGQERVIPLEAVRLAGGVGTSIQAYERFLRRLNGEDF